MPLTNKEQEELRRLQAKYGPKPVKERPLSALERSAERQNTQSFGDLNLSGPYAGSGLAIADSITLGNKYKPEKPLRPSLVLADSSAKLILEGKPTEAAKLRVTTPPTPSYSMREVTGPDGKPTLVWVNNSTREILPVKGGFSPTTAKAGSTRTRPISDVTKKFTDTVESSDEIMSEPALGENGKKNETLKYPEGSPVRVAAENRSRAAEDSLSIAANAERMGYADFNEAAADLKNLEDTYAEYEEMEKRLGRDKAVTEFTRINGKHPALVKQMIYNFRRPLNLSR